MSNLPAPATDFFASFRSLKSAARIVAMASGAIYGAAERRYRWGGS